MMRNLIPTLCILAAIDLATAFYLPGVAPREFQDGDQVNLKVIRIDSVKTQLPYEYYALPFCQPPEIINAAENLGEVLRGDRIENSIYQLNMGREESCKILCRQQYTPELMSEFAEKVHDEYRVHWIVDNLPAATRVLRDTPNSADLTATYERGYPIGFVGGTEMVRNSHTAEGVPYIYNHVRLVIKYHKDKESFVGNRIVGFEVEPFSVKHKYEDWPNLKSCTPLRAVQNDMEPQRVDAADEIVWTYDVKWDFSDIKWASRWDLYVLTTDDQIHWFSIINSLMIVIFLSGMVAMIMLRTLNQDIRTYNEVQDEEEGREETGWKLVHGDVFRPPAMFNLLSVAVGTGCQLTACALIVLITACLGFLSPANRGGLVTAMLFLFVFMGIFAGYFGSRTYKMCKGVDWKTNTIMTALWYPTIVFSVFFFLNLFVWGEHSSGAVPFPTMLILMFLWFGISVPLVFLGAYFGFKKKAVEFPVTTHQIPRMVPEQAWYMHPIISIAMGGLLPFGAVFIELFFILSSIWLHHYYYVFGFLLLVFCILAVTCSEICIVMCYFQLCSEDYHWWWRSFLTAGSSAFYMFAYSIFYFYTKLEITKFVSTLLFFGYMWIISFTFFILTGTIGFVACFMFVYHIYGAIKVD